MAAHKDPRRRARESRIVGSVLAQLILASIAIYLPSAWVTGSLVLYGVVVLLAIITSGVAPFLFRWKDKKRSE